jgi:hypothetical protein
VCEEPITSLRAHLSKSLKSKYTTFSNHFLQVDGLISEILRGNLASSTVGVASVVPGGLLVDGGIAPSAPHWALIGL